MSSFNVFSLFIIMIQGTSIKGEIKSFFCSEWRGFEKKVLLTLSLKCQYQTHFTYCRLSYKSSSTIISTYNGSKLLQPNAEVEIQHNHSLAQ